MSFLKSTLVTFSTQVTTVILSIISSIVIARVLGPSGNGAYSLIILLPTLMASFGNLGIDVSNLYFAGKKKYQLYNIASNSLILAFTIGIVLSSVFLVYLHISNPPFLKEINPQHIFVATIGLPFIILISYFNLILLGENKIYQYNFINLSQAGIRFMLLLFSFFIIKAELGGAVFAWTGGIIITAIIAVVLVLKLTKIGWSLHFLLLKDSVKFGLQGYLGNVISFLNYRLDIFLVSSFMGITFVGYYSVAANLAESLWYFPGAVGAMILSRTPRTSVEDANTFTPVVCRNTVFLTLILAIFLFSFGKIIINLLFGPSFLPALKPMWILMPGIIALSINKVLSNELTGRGKPIVGAIAGAISLVINIPLNLIFIPRWGIEGAAFASTVSYSAAAITVLYVFIKISKNSLLDLIIIKPEDLKTYIRIISNIKTPKLEKVSR